jgi:hypothetical protein
MSETNAASPRIARASRFIRLAVSRFIWLLVLAPILALSAYSLFWIGTRLGVPPLIAITISTCFDGAALVSADYSLKYVQKGLSGTFPRTVTRVLALLSAFLQTLHAKLGHEPPGAWIMWAALPVIAVVLFDIHLRFERQKALARSGAVYPAPLPQWGIASWLLFPLRTLNDFREIVAARREALKLAGLTVIGDFAHETSRLRNTRERIEPARPEPKEDAEVIKPEVLEEHRERRHTAPKARNGSWAKRHSPELHIREWARADPEWRHRVGERGRVPADVKEAYRVAHPEEASGL